MVSDSHRFLFLLEEERLSAPKERSEFDLYLMDDSL